MYVCIYVIFAHSRDSFDILLSYYSRQNVVLITQRTYFPSCVAPRSE